MTRWYGLRLNSFLRRGLEARSSQRVQEGDERLPFLGAYSLAGSVPRHRGQKSQGGALLDDSQDGKGNSGKYKMRGSLRSASGRDDSAFVERLREVQRESDGTAKTPGKSGDECLGA